MRWIERTRIWTAWAGALLVLGTTLPVEASEGSSSSPPANEGAPGWLEPAKLQLEQTGRGCMSEGDLVLCWSSAFRLLEDRRLELATELAITRAHLLDAWEDLDRERALAQAIADTAARAARREVELWRDHAAELEPTWWDRHRPVLGWGSGVAGTAALAGGVWVLTQGGDPAAAVGLLLSGAGLEVVGYLLAQPP